MPRWARTARFTELVLDDGRKVCADKPCLDPMSDDEADELAYELEETDGWQAR